MAQAHPHWKPSARRSELLIVVQHVGEQIRLLFSLRPALPLPSVAGQTRQFP